MTVTVRAGAEPGGAVVATLTTTRDPVTGAFSVPSSSALAAGTYSVQVAQSDDLGHTGTSAARTFAVAAAPPPPPTTTTPTPPAPPTPDDPTPTPPSSTADRRAPVLSGVSLTRTRFRVGAAPRRLSRGTVLRYGLDEPATLTISITQTGRSAILMSLAHRGASGAGRLAISGRSRGKTLRSGRYRMTIRATDAAGNRSAARTVSFRVG